VDCNYTLYGRSWDSWGFSNAWYLHCQLSTNHLILSHQTSSVNGEDAVQTGVFVSDAPVKLLRWLTIKNCVPFYLLCGTSGNFTPNTAFEMMQDKRCRHGIPSGSSIRLNGAWASDWPFIIIYLLLAALGWRNTWIKPPESRSVGQTFPRTYSAWRPFGSLFLTVCPIPGWTVCPKPLPWMSRECHAVTPRNFCGWFTRPWWPCAKLDGVPQGRQNSGKIWRSKPRQ